MGVGKEPHVQSQMVHGMLSYPQASMYFLVITSKHGGMASLQLVKVNCVTLLILA